MSIFSTKRHGLALAVLTVVVIAGLGTFGAMRVDSAGGPALSYKVGSIRVKPPYVGFQKVTA